MRAPQQRAPSCSTALFSITECSMWWLWNPAPRAPNLESRGAYGRADMARRSGGFPGSGRLHDFTVQMKRGNRGRREWRGEWCRGAGKIGLRLCSPDWRHFSLTHFSLTHSEKREGEGREITTTREGVRDSSTESADWIPGPPRRRGILLALVLFHPPRPFNLPYSSSLSSSWLSSSSLLAEQSWVPLVLVVSVGSALQQCCDWWRWGNTEPGVVRVKCLVVVVVKKEGEREKSLVLRFWGSLGLCLRRGFSPGAAEEVGGVSMTELIAPWRWPGVRVRAYLFCSFLSFCSLDMWPWNSSLRLRWRCWGGNLGEFGRFVYWLGCWTVWRGGVFPRR